MDIRLQDMHICCHSVLDTESSGFLNLSGGSPTPNVK
jgi:hypothetical protein